MARPIKKGLSYFPLDVDFFSDKKIKRLRVKYGNDGIMVYIYLLCEIYRNGYYIDYDEDLILDISDELNISENSTKQILNYLLSRSLFDSKLAQSVKVLTAASIQRQYQEVKKKGKTIVDVDAKFWVLKKDETESSIKVRPIESFSENNRGFSEKNSDKSEINDTKESKEKKSKVKGEKSIEASPSPLSIRNLFENICASYGKVKYISEIIEKEIRKSCKFYSENDFKTVFEKAEKSSFLKGENSRNWKACFEWLVKAENMQKVLNGCYDDFQKKYSFDMKDFKDLTNDFDVSEYVKFANNFPEE